MTRKLDHRVLHTSDASHRRTRVLITAAAVVSAIAWTQSVTMAAESQQWAVLIGVTKHDDASLNLQFTDRDVKSLERVLVERAGMTIETDSTNQSHILEFHDAFGYRPTLTNIQQHVPAFLKRIGPNDRLTIFFSGHGITEDGETYLVPADFKRSDPSSTALSTTWLQEQLRACAAKSKFLIIDACHAGGARPSNTSLPAEQLAKAVDVEGVSGCVILASCRSNEKSWEWSERRNGVFTYWLCRALEGGADEDGDGTVTTDEVNAYVHERVKTTVSQLYNETQSTVRIAGEDVDGAAQSLLTLTPEPPESVCRRLADHLDLEIRFRKLKKVGVLEFLMPIGRSAGGLSQANLPQYCSEEVRSALRSLSDGAYEVVDQGALLTASKGVRVEEIGDPTSMRRLSDRVGGLDCVVTGDLRRRGSLLRVQCELVTTNDGVTLAEPTGVLPLSPVLLADAGSSFNAIEQPAGDPHDQGVLDWATDAAHQGHPLLQNGFPFEVEVWSIEAAPTDQITAHTPRRKKEFVKRETDDRSELLLRAREDEVFEVRVLSKYRDPVTVAIAVDGINVLGKQRELLALARRWHQEPGKTYNYEGWYIEKTLPSSSATSLGFDRRRFVFKGLPDAQTGRQTYGDSLGLIMVAFFDASGRLPATGNTMYVGEAQSDDQLLHTVPYRSGRLLGVVQIRYVDEASGE